MTSYNIIKLASYYYKMAAYYYKMAAYYYKMTYVTITMFSRAAALFSM
jgi:hypothetical protein